MAARRGASSPRWRLARRRSPARRRRRRFARRTRRSRRTPAGLGGRRGGAQGRRQRDRRRLRDGAGAGRRAPRLVRDRRRWLRDRLSGQGEEELRARLPRACAGGDHAGRSTSRTARSSPSCRSAAAWRSRCRARCAASARWCGAGASCRSAAASTARRSSPRVGFPVSWRLAQSLARDRSQGGRRQEVHGDLRRQAARRGDALAPARAGLDARQAARGRRRRLLQGRGGEGDRQGGGERGRRAQRRGSRRLHGDRPDAARAPTTAGCASIRCRRRRRAASS